MLCVFLMSFITDHLASVGSAAGQQEGQDRQTGWPGFSVNPVGQTDEATEHAASLCALQQPGSVGTKLSLCIF